MVSLRSIYTAVPSFSLFFIILTCQEYSYTPLNLGDVAVVTGDYDSIQTILDQFEVEYTLYDGYINGPFEEVYHDIPEDTVESLLMNRDILLTYDILFINCGARGMGSINPVRYEEDNHLIEDESVIANLIEFVQGGGYLYVSDWAYDIVERAFPDWIDFMGEDTEPDSAQVGKAGIVEVTLRDEKMKEELGKGTIQVNFNYDVWALIESTRAEVLAEGTVEYFDDYPDVDELPNAPLMIHFDEGKGKVFFTSFHYENSATQDTLNLLYYLIFKFEREE